MDADCTYETRGVSSTIVLVGEGRVINTSAPSNVNGCSFDFYNTIISAYMVEQNLSGSTRLILRTYQSPVQSSSDDFQMGSLSMHTPHNSNEILMSDKLSIEVVGQESTGFGS